MKKIISIILFLVSLTSVGQTPQSRSSLLTPAYSFTSRELPQGTKMNDFLSSFHNIVDDGTPIVTSSTYTNPSWLYSIDWTKITGSPTTYTGYGLSTSSSNFYSTLSDPTGTGSCVFSSGPSISSPTITGSPLFNSAITATGSITTPTLYGSSTNSVLNIFSNPGGYGLINIGTGTGTVTINNPTNINAGLSWNGSYNYNRNYLQDYDSKISKVMQGVASATAIVACIGDSWYAGNYFTSILASNLRLKFGDAGCGYYGAGVGNAGSIFGNNNQYVTRTKVGSWTNEVGTSYVRSMALSLDSSSAVNDSIYYVGVMTDAIIHYMKKPSGGSFVTRVDGASPSTITTSGTATLATTSITGLTEGTHTISIKVSSAGTGVLICGAEINRNNNGVRVHNLGCSGTTSTQWINQDSLSWTNGLKQLNPNLICITLGVNDCVQGIPVSTYTSNINRLVNRAKAAMPLASILLISQGDISTVTTYPMTSYLAALKSFALANNYGYIDNYSLLGSYTNANSRGMYSDAVHPSVSGGQLIANNILNYLMNGTNMYYDWNTNFNIGKNSLLSVNSSGTYNTATGVNSMSNTTTGSSNAAYAYNSLLNNTTGSQNSAFGHSSMTYNTIGTYNSAFGFGSLNANTTGSLNAVFGANAMLSNTTGYSNAAFGYQALKASTFGIGNTAFGSNALAANTGSTWDNVAIGSGALSVNTSGKDNTAIGYYAGGGANSTGSNNIFIGSFAGYRETGSNIFRIDNQARSNLTTEQSNSIMWGIMAATPSAQTVQINAHTKIMHIVGNSTSPTATLSTGAGTGGTYTLSSHSTDAAITFSLTSGTTCAANSSIADFTFSVPYNTAPIVVISPGNANAASLNTNAHVYTTSTTTGFSIKSNTAGIPDGSSYVFNIHIIE